MSLPYTLRLLCLLAVVVALMNAVLQGALAAGAQRILCLLEPLSPRRRERVLYLIQIAPLAAAVLFAGTCCIPEYLRHEPDSGAEGVSRLCLFLSATALVWFGSAIVSGLRVVLRTARFRRALRGAASARRPASEGLPVWIVQEPRYLVALVGLLRPVVLVSQDLADALDDRAVAIALDHERSHAAQRDNWKLLSLRFLPLLPPRITGCGRWLHLWQEAAEWAADEDAAGHDPGRRLLLADTLVRVARGRSRPEPAIIQTALSCAAVDIEQRVMRLLRAPDAREKSGGGSAARRAVLLLLGAAALAAVAAAAFSPWIYAASETLLHLG